jgi:hypothetical protein
MVRSDVVGVESVGVGETCTASMSLAALLTPVVQLNISIVNDWPAVGITEAGRMIIWLAMGSACTPPT